VKGAKARDSPKRTWGEVVQKDCQAGGGGYGS